MPLKIPSITSGQNIESFLISLIYFLPYGIILGLLAFIIGKFLRKKSMQLPRIGKMIKIER